MQRRPLLGSELAWRAILLGQFGIGLRAIDHCAGGVRVRDLLISPFGVTSQQGMTRATLRAAALRKETHGRGGHDPGCASIGLPLSLIDRTLHCWDASGAGALISEAMQEAVTDILDDTQRTGAWRPGYAHESLNYAIERRITPRAERVIGDAATGPPRTLKFAATPLKGPSTG